MIPSFFQKKVTQLSQTLGLDLNYFLGGGFWIGLSLIISLCVGLITSSLFSYLWPPDVYGKYSFFTTVFSFITLTALPGMSQIVLQAAAEGKDAVYKQAVKEVIKWSLVGSIFLFIGFVYFHTRHNFDLSYIFLLAVIAFPLTNTSNLSPSFLTGKKLFKQSSLLTIIVQIATLTGTAGALLFIPSFIGVATIAIATNVCASLLVFFITTKKIENNKTDHKLLSFGKHLSLSQVFILVVDYTDRFLIPFFLGFTNNAIYAFALIIPLQIHSFLKVFITLGQIKIAENSPISLKKNLAKKTFQLEIIIFLIVLLYILFSPLIFSILYPQYKESALFLSQIYAISLLYFPTNLFGLSLIKIQAKKELYLINFIYCIFSIGSLVILMYFFGLLGAVISRVLSKLLQGFLNVFFFYTAKNLRAT